MNDSYCRCLWEQADDFPTKIVSEITVEKKGEPNVRQDKTMESIRVRFDCQVAITTSLKERPERRIAMMDERLMPMPVNAEEKKTLWDDSGDEAIYYNTVWYRCPRCGKFICTTHKRTDIHYCSDCGQAIDWKEGDGNDP